MRSPLAVSSEYPAVKQLKHKKPDENRSTPKIVVLKSIHCTLSVSNVILHNVTLSVRSVFVHR